MRRRTEAETRSLLMRGAAIVASAVCATALSAQSTGRLSGRVTGADGSLLGQVSVVATTPSGEQRRIVTNSNGQFVFDDLPDGPFRISAHLPGLLTTVFGSTELNPSGVWVAATLGQGAGNDIAMTLRSGGAISGRIVDPESVPMPGVRVVALLSNRADGVKDDITDREGRFRIHLLEPGNYVVAVEPPKAASAGRRPSNADNDAMLQSLREASAPGAKRTAPWTNNSEVPYAYLPIFYPGVLHEREAVPLTVQSGVETGGVLIRLAPAPSVEISGRVITHDLSIDSALINLQRLDTTYDLGVRPTFAPTVLRMVNGEADFRFRALSPGDYLITVRSRRLVGDLDRARDRTHWGLLEARAVSSPLHGTVVELRPSAAMTGAVVLNPDAETAGVNVSSVSLSLVPLPWSQRTLPAPWGSAPPPAIVHSDGSFVIPEVPPGEYQLVATVPDQPDWRIHSAIFDGRELLDAPLSISESTLDIAGVVVSVTPTRTTVSGQVRGLPDFSDYVVVIAGTDEQTWFPASRRIAVAPIASDGQFEVKGLPSGRYYIGVAENLGDAALREPRTLRLMLPSAAQFEISKDGSHVIQNFSVAGPTH